MIRGSGLVTTPAPLVPGRECGACSACCEWLWVDTPEFRKPPSTLCAQASPSGCRIYLDRPPICRAWFCGWRRFEIFPEDWRPDRSGVIATMKDTEIPADYEKRTGLIFLLFWPLEMVLQTEFISLLSAFIDNRTPVFLAIPGPPGFKPLQFFANNLLEDANRAQDAERFLAVLLAALRELDTLEFKPV
jgi:hypothetical protein